MGYRYEGKQKTLSFGAYPAVSLKDARNRREEAKEQLAAGIDPSAQKKAVKAAIKADATNSFEVVAREWFDKYKGSWVNHHGKKILARLENDIFPLIGAKAVGAGSISVPTFQAAAVIRSASIWIRASGRTLPPGTMPKAAISFPSWRW